MNDEKCANCGKPKDQHIIDGTVSNDRVWCYPTLGSREKWQAPEPQAALFADVHRTTGYEL